MALTYNGNVVNNVTYNGNIIDYIVYNGTLVWSRSTTSADIELSFVEKSHTNIDVDSNEVDISGITDSVEIDLSLADCIISTKYKTKYTYNSAYVMDDDEFMLETTYTYVGEDMTIDSGYLVSVSVDKDKFSSITGIEVT